MYSAHEISRESQSAGFSWGYSLGPKTQQQEAPNVQLRKDSGALVALGAPHSAPTPAQPRCKRQFDDGDGESWTKGALSANVRPESAPVLRKYMVAKKRPSMFARAPVAVVPEPESSSAYVPTSIGGLEGQPLPMPRSLELMDKAQLQDVIMDLVNVHPQVAQYLQSSISQYSFSSDKRLAALRNKLHEVHAAVPYNRDYANDTSAQLDDYAFVRIKPLVLEFLNCLTDYILAAMPPRSTSVQESLVFLDACTQMVTELPRFQLPSNNYYYDKCLEQLAYIWCTLIEHMARQETPSAAPPTTPPTGATRTTPAYPQLLLEADNIREKLQGYNARANNLLARPIELLKQLTSIGRQNALNQQHQPHQNFNILTSNHPN
ncbi:Sts1 protein [Maudiozyma humilis]|uniref:Tethering factor for nuclear proteasome STS1 n=1 Tax=Maudiozyma humilis TaxID=51915 RepID=A0AAV5RYV6_MAUHU|nr:Sts1 protein [Kazachstania humilis]